MIQTLEEAALKLFMRFNSSERTKPYMVLIFITTQIISNERFFFKEIMNILFSKEAKLMATLQVI